MDPGLILLLGFLLAVIVARAVFSYRKSRASTYRFKPDPDAPEPPSEASPRPRASYGAARSRTRNRR